MPDHIHHSGELVFVWDSAKATENPTNHNGVTFEDAAAAFADDMAVVLDDPEHSSDEERCLLLGDSRRAGILKIVFMDRGDQIRIISAWRANKREQAFYRNPTLEN